MIMFMSTISPPKRLGAAEVIAFTTIDSRVHRTNKSKHLIGGKQVGSAAGLAISRYAGERGYYLFFCDSNWNPYANTWHETIDDAKRAAEFEYEGSSDTWQSIH
jgi:hypothetical protein